VKRTFPRGRAFVSRSESWFLTRAPAQALACTPGPLHTPIRQIHAISNKQRQPRQARETSKGGRTRVRIALADIGEEAAHIVRRQIAKTSDCEIRRLELPRCVLSCITHIHTCQIHLEPHQQTKRQLVRYSQEIARDASLLHQATPPCTLRQVHCQRLSRDTPTHKG